MSTNECGLSDKEIKLMSQSWQCFDDNPKINFEKLAGLGGYTNVKSCQNAWGAIKKKLTAAAAAEEKKSAAGSEGGGAAAKTPVKATPKKRGRAKKATGEGADLDDEESPVKKVKATPKKQKGKSSKTSAKEGSDDEVVKAEAEDEDTLI